MEISEDVLTELLSFYRQAYEDEKERADGLEKRIFKLLRFPEEETKVVIPEKVEPVQRRSRYGKLRQMVEEKYRNGDWNTKESIEEQEKNETTEISTAS